MEQFKIKKDHKLSEENIQGLELTQLLQNSEAFENFFFPPDSMDYNPDDAKGYIDMDELYKLLNEENSDEGVNGKGCGSNMALVQMNINDVVMEAKVEDVVMEAKNYVKRKRYRKGSVEYVQMMELKKIKNRQTAARYFEQKKVYVEQLELTVKKFREKNTCLEKLLQFGKSSLSSGRAQKQLRRTASGPL